MDHYPFRKFITSSADLLEIIQRIRDYRGALGFHTGCLIHEMYRGQGRSSWKLLPNLSRDIKNPSSLKIIEKNIITDFREELTKGGLTKHIQQGFLNGSFHNDWLLIQQAQHYRLPTRFMDWTIDWEVALFFTVSNPKDDHFDGHFWIYLVKQEMFVTDNNRNIYLDQDPFEFSGTIFLNSSTFLSEKYLSHIALRRKFRQNGRFCIQPLEKSIYPLEDQDVHKGNLFLITVPHHLKKYLRDELAEKDLTAENLFIEEESEIKNIVHKIRKKYGM